MIPLDLVLENQHVLLRPLQESDLLHLRRFMQEEPELWRYSLMPIFGPDDLQNYIRAALVGRAAGKEFPFIVWDKQQQMYAGSTRYYDIQYANQMLQIGYTWIGKHFQGTLVNKSCKYLMLEYAFDVLGMQRVEFRADVRNQRSRQAMLSIGCRYEGILRSHMPLPEGNRRDSIILSILRTEWNDYARAGLLQKLQ